MPHLDIPQFKKQTGGSTAVMQRVAQAYSDQLPIWRTEFTAAHSDPEQLALLLHKIKGSCHAISATKAAKAFEQAEQRLQAPRFEPQTELPKLLKLLAEIEAELQVMLALQH